MFVNGWAQFDKQMCLLLHTRAEMFRHHIQESVICKLMQGEVRVKEDEYQRFLRRHEKRPVQEKQRMTVWQAIRSAKKWIFFLLVQALLTNRNR